MKDTKYFKDKREYCTRQKVIKKYEGRPSILKIKKNIVLDKRLSRNMKDTQVF